MRYSVWNPEKSPWSHALCLRKQGILRKECHHCKSALYYLLNWISGEVAHFRVKKLWGIFKPWIVVLFSVLMVKNPARFFLQPAWVCHASFLSLFLWNFKFLAHTFSGRIGSHSCPSYNRELLSRITQKSLPGGVSIWPLGLLFYFLDSFQLYLSLPITMATTLLLLEAFLNWPSRIKPSFFCDIVPLCSFAHCPSVLIDTFIRHLQYAGQGTRLRM